MYIIKAITKDDLSSSKPTEAAFEVGEQYDTLADAIAEVDNLMRFDVEERDELDYWIYGPDRKTPIKKYTGYRTGNKSVSTNPITQARLTKGWSQTKLAEKAGIPRGTVQNYEQDRREPSVANLQKLAAALGCKLEKLL